jgi:predicted ArsR family transcriptional regulator
MADPERTKAGLVVLIERHVDDRGWCIWSQVKMAAELGCSRASVQRALGQLCNAALIEKKLIGAVPDDPGRPSASYTYRVRIDRDLAELRALRGAWHDARPETRKQFLDEILSPVCSASAPSEPGGGER